jgi:hypothetical protein
LSTEVGTETRRFPDAPDSEKVIKKIKTPETRRSHGFCYSRSQAAAGRYAMAVGQVTDAELEWELQLRSRLTEASRSANFERGPQSRVSTLTLDPGWLRFLANSASAIHRVSMGVPSDHRKCAKATGARQLQIFANRYNHY